MSFAGKESPTKPVNLRCLVMTFVACLQNLWTNELHRKAQSLIRQHDKWANLGVGCSHNTKGLTCSLPS